MKNIFETFNARYLSLEDVAKSFIPNRDFIKLYQSSHSILMGPRGCGKTTLFKMLTPRAINVWNSENSKQHKTKINFWGIYIPADKQWDRQLKNFQVKFHDQSFQKIITKCIITTNVLNSIVDTFSDLIDIYINEDQDKLDYQAKIAKDLIEIWDIEGPISASFLEIKKSLKKRIININTIINKVEFGILKIGDIKWENYYFHNYIDLASSAFDIFESYLYRESIFTNKQYKWALCFDELEIVPNWVTNEILEYYLRSTNQKLLFKLATAPLINWRSEYNINQLTTNAQDKQDFLVIRSWVYNYQSRKDWEEFCENFILSKINIHENNKINLQILFGTHNLNNALKDSEKKLGARLSYDEKADFHEGSLMYVITKKLAQQDKSFYDFLNSKNINPLDPKPTNSLEVDSIFRKIKPTIVYRYYFYKRSNVRSRKSISLYHGYPFISELTDGNPRVLINLLSTFLNKQRANFNNLTQIPLSTQGNIIQNFSSEYFYQITNHPEASRYIMINGEKALLSLRNLLEIIGKWFFNKLIKAPFKMDTVNCFVVDKKVDLAIIDLIKLAVDLGAIQFLVDKEDIILSNENIQNSKFRFSYILCPHFRLPKRSDNSISLSIILGDTLYSKSHLNTEFQTKIKWND